MYVGLVEEVSFFVCFFRGEFMCVYVCSIILLLTKFRTVLITSIKIQQITCLKEYTLQFCCLQTNEIEHYSRRILQIFFLTLQVWSLETGQRLVTLRNHSDGVTCLQFNDSVIVSGSYDKTVKLWDFTSC